MMGGVSAGGTAWWLAACVSMLAFWLIVVMVAITLTRRGHPRDESGSGSTSPQRILDERLASGEITEDEYLQREAMLRGTR
jgi:uncharacterized membrane protein